MVSYDRPTPTIRLEPPITAMIDALKLAEYPPGFKPTAFWFFPDWGVEDQGSVLGFKRPFWMNEPKKPEQVKVLPPEPIKEAKRDDKVSGVYWIDPYKDEIERIYKLINQPQQRPIDKPLFTNTDAYDQRTLQYIHRFHCIKCRRQHQIKYDDGREAYGVQLRHAKFVCNDCLHQEDADKYAEERP